MSTPQWFLYSKDYLFFFLSSDGTSMSVLGVKSSRYPFCVSSFLCWDSSSASAWQTEEGEIETFTWKVFNGPRLGTPRVTLAWILLASAQSPATELQGRLGNVASLCLAEAGKGVVDIWSASLQAGTVSVGPEPAKVLHMRSIMNKACWMNE